MVGLYLAYGGDRNEINACFFQHNAREAARYFIAHNKSDAHRQPEAQRHQGGHHANVYN